MGIVRAMPDLQAWLDANADSWSSLADREYKALVRRWSDVFSPLVAAGDARLHGRRAMTSLEERLPASVFVVSGLRVPRFANTGGYGAAAYEAELRHAPRDSANHMELVLISIDFSWSCIFSHEAGTLVWEQLYECEGNASEGGEP